MKPVTKKILLALIIPVGIFLVIIFAWWMGSSAYSGWQGYTWQKQTDQFQEALRKPYKEDTYGGKTPEETWNMFLDALQKGDIELASKYFVVDKQEKEREFLLKEQKLDKLKLVIDQLSSPLIRERDSMQSETKIYYSYNFTDSKTKQVYSNQVIFILNSYTKIWKISVL